MVELVQVAYDIRSPFGSVQACLTEKRRAAEVIEGIGPASCCSFVSYLDGNGTPGAVFGNSRIRIPFAMANGPDPGQDVRNACCHGELVALWHLFNEQNAIPQILEMYIEMSPCPNCEVALNNILPQQLVIYYSFRYGADTEAWRAAAVALCR